MRLLPALLAFAALTGLSASAAAATLDLQLTDQQGEPLSDAVVYVETVDGKALPTEPMQAEVDQVDEMFVPHVRAITVGSRVRFPNSDQIHHHVYSFSEAKNFELKLYTGETDPIVFDTAGLVTLGCNIHDHMLGYILVLATPHFAESSAGRAQLTNLPAGEISLAIWHPRLASEQPLQRKVQLGADQQQSLSVQLELRPERALRRAPRRGSSRY